MHVTVYSKPGCHLCEDVLQIIDRLAPRYDLDVNEVNILDDETLYKQYHEKIPVVMAGDGSLGILYAPIAEPELHTYFDMARRAEAGDKASVVPYIREPLLDRVLGYLAERWLRVLTILVGVFVGLPWLAPVFAALDWWGLADPIYTAYAFTCHQLPERAGNVLGYQVAFCYRNTAIYAGIFLFGILFGLARDRKVRWLQWLRKPLNGWLFIVLLMPMFVDGVTHMLGLRDSTNMSADPQFGDFFVGSQVGSLNWWLRIITGSLAALAGVWFAYPRMQRQVEASEAMRQAYLWEAAMRYAMRNRRSSAST